MEKKKPKAWAKSQPSPPVLHLTSRNSSDVFKKNNNNDGSLYLPFSNVQIAVISE